MIADICESVKEDLRAAITADVINDLTTKARAVAEQQAAQDAVVPDRPKDLPKNMFAVTADGKRLKRSVHDDGTSVYIGEDDVYEQVNDLEGMR